MVWPMSVEYRAVLRSVLTLRETYVYGIPDSDHPSEKEKNGELIGINHVMSSQKRL